MIRFLALVMVGLGATHCSDKKEIISTLPVTPFEKSKGKATTTYEEAIDFYKEVSRVSKKVSITAWGETDAGIPLHLVTYDVDGIFDPTVAHQNNKIVLFINNGIHPGEPCGIDASMLLIK
ncbi:MAG: hypothetical protein ACOC0C_07995, partial [Bacteroidota bacterium]